MATLTTPDLMLNKVVVAYLDGRRSRGCVYDFSPLKDTFRLVSESGSLQHKSEVELKDLKAVFFVRDFRGNSKYKESKRFEEGKPGRKIEVTVSDGEKVIGRTQAYNPKSKGFCVSSGCKEQQTSRICSELTLVQIKILIRERKKAEHLIA
jgi:hypothetical protein